MHEKANLYRFAFFVFVQKTSRQTISATVVKSGREIPTGFLSLCTTGVCGKGGFPADDDTVKFPIFAS